MLREMLLGTAAGAVGMVALNAATYADMAVRARPSSSLPAGVAGRLAFSESVELGSENTAQNRSSGLGALSWYAVGPGVGTTYKFIQPRLGRVEDTCRGRGRACRDGQERGAGCCARCDEPGGAGRKQLVPGRPATFCLRFGDGGGVRLLHRRIVTSIGSPGV
jgi:hypothetical protein